MTMALGKHREEQQEMWVATTSLPKSVGHVFYRKLNRLLAEADFDRMVEEMCEPYYHTHLGRPSIPPGVYFRMLLVGYYEGIGSQRGIAWRCADSLSLREFLGIPLTEEAPDHSSLTRVRDRLPLETHAAVFQWVLALAASGRKAGALRELARLARANAVGDWRFTEWFEGEGEAPHGMSGQTWNAALFLLAREGLDKKIF